MITRIEGLNYRCLRYLSRPLGTFHVLVGPNASGKTTFLDVVAFLKDVVSENLDAALSNRTTNPQDLLFQRRGDTLELAVEVQIPNHLRELTANTAMDTARYEVAIGFDETQRRFEFKAEKFMLKKVGASKPVRPSLFPCLPNAPASLLTPKGRRNNKVVVNKVQGGNDNFYSETYPRSGKGWTPSFKLGTQKSALSNLPEDTTLFPVATWFREYLIVGVQRFVLNSSKMRLPSPPTRVTGFFQDGSNLPWVVARLRKDNAERHRHWIAHLQTALPDLVDITTTERPEDKHCYMIDKYASGLHVPSWLVSTARCG